MKEIEIWVVIDEDGEWSVGEDRDAAIERHEENVGGVAGARLVKITAQVSVPAPVELAVRIPDQSGEFLVESGADVV